MVTLASLIATGAIHEASPTLPTPWAVAGQTRERVLAILKDSRIGAFGGAAIAIVKIGAS